MKNENSSSVLSQALPKYQAPFIPVLISFVLLMFHVVPLYASQSQERKSQDVSCYILYEEDDLDEAESQEDENDDDTDEDSDDEDVEDNDE